MSAQRVTDKPAATRLRYRLLSQLPGDTGLKYLRKHSLARKASVARAFDDALRAARGTVCVDLGANLGVISRRMAAVAQSVHAVEPDPWTAARLRENLADLPNVTVTEAAAGPAAGTVLLRRRATFRDDPEAASQASSVVDGKTGMGGDAFEVDQIDLPAFLSALDARVGVLKIDIEGAEVALLEALLDHPVIAQIDAIFVETHETKLPRALARRSLALRRRVRAMTRPRVEMDWN